MEERESFEEKSFLPLHPLYFPLTAPGQPKVRKKRLPARVAVTSLTATGCRLVPAECHRDRLAEPLLGVLLWGEN